MEKSAFAVRPYEVGWHRPDDHGVREAIRAAHLTRPLLSAGTALSDHAAVAAAGVGVALVAAGSSSAAAGAAVAVGLLVTGRAQRGLEVLVHECSHGNLHRASRPVNDRLGDLLAAWSVGLSVAEYREGHSLHHRFYATDRDPDRARYKALDVERLDRSSRGSYLRGLLRRVTGYSATWWYAVGSSPGCLFRAAVATALLQVLPAYLLGGTGAAFASAFLAASAFLLVTPVIRFVGETSEHQYLRASTVLDTTVTNVGPLQRLLIHPHGDGWHQLHHILPGVPHHRLRRLHRDLVGLDPAGYGAGLRYRTRVRDEPQTLLRRPMAGVR